MTTNRLECLWKKNLHLHHMNDCDDLNFYYKKFLNKLSKLCLKIFLPLLSLIYLFTLFLCRLFLSNQIFDIRTISLLLLIFLTFILLILIRLHKRWKKLWILTRFLIIFLLIIPLIISYQTEQFHILLSAISIIIMYALLTFTLLQSLLISISISILHISLLLNRQTNQIQWKSLEFISIIFYHFIINIFGLYSYIQSIKYLRQHFNAYKKNLLEKNKYNVDCKKLHTIIGYCQQSQSISNINLQSKSGTVINCCLSLNEQTRTHTCDELASLIDVLYCQIEQLIIKIQPTAYYIFDNETIIITLLNENNNEQLNIDNSCRLAIELFRFIQHVNNITQWNLKLIIGIDYNQINIYSLKYIEGLAYDYSRWLREECLINNHIHVSSRIYNILKENQFYKFSLITNHSTYLLSNETMYESYNNNNNNNFTSLNISDMIDQLTRIQVDYYIKKNFNTKTLTHSLRKQSLFELTSKNLYWFSLNFKENYLKNEFQIIHRTNRLNCFIYIFILIILIGSLLQSFIIDYLNIYYLILYPLIIIGLILFIIIFYCSIHMNNSDRNKKFYVYLNILICITLTILVFVAIQYHSIQNFQHLFISNQLINKTTIITKLNNLSTNQINSTIHQLSLHRQYHEYLVLTPIYPLYFCTLFRQCSWLIKTFFIIICSILQLYILEYIWLTTNIYFLSINSLHHYTTLSLIIFHNFLLIILSYIHEWLEKIDFIWFKQIDNERLIIIRQRNQLIKQTSLILPLRVINYYLNTNTNTNLSLIQHYHYKYDQMGLLYIRFNLLNNQDEYSLINFINNIEYLLKNNDKYNNIVMHKKSTIKEIIFSIDLLNSLKSIQELVEFLFQINENIKLYHQINLIACLHIGCINEILIHFEKYPKIDIWSEHISFIQLLISKIQINHCLVTSSVYHLLNELYLFRIAGSIIKTSMNIENNTNIYFLLGRLIGDNIFQGRNALPLTINQSNNDILPKSSSIDDSQYQYKHNYHNDKNPSTTTTTTTSSSGILNDQQSLLKQSSRKRNHTLNGNSSQSSYRHTLLQALDSTTNNLHQISPMKKFSKMIHSNENNSWSSKETITSASKYLILTQKLLNKSTGDNNRSKSTPPLSNHPLSSERKNSTDNKFNQLLHEQSPKDIINLSHSLSPTNEETNSSFSGWDDPCSSLLPINNEKQQESIKQTSSSPIIDSYYPSHPCDLSFTVNMTTTTPTDPKSTTPTVTSQQQEIPKFRTVPFNLARKLIAETSESEISIQHEPWTQNIVYQSNDHQQIRLSSSYNNLSNLHSKEVQLPSSCHRDFLQNWLEDQLNQFRGQTKQIPILLTRKSKRFSTIENDSTDDDESDTIQDHTYPILNTKSTKYSHNHIRYKPIRKNSNLIRHESLKHRNRPLSFENNLLKKFSKRTDSSSIPHSDLSDISSVQLDNLSQSILSNIESDYDNMYTECLNSNPTTTTTIMNNSQIITDDDSDDQTTLTTTINRHYF
ncbi:unnamed protein product [Rotaria sordida]|uniref:Uncharacterized protein n=1 Tax=Rotaria sordida TaxID=392033 RepID=A0A814J0N0_9BILA|nr:unnamed protein product [Rotaria sordida]CAF1032998.1 unnamed protein product [Rotaria sordida]